jgi:multidrug resistance efflux pump
VDIARTPRSNRKRNLLLGIAVAAILVATAALTRVRTAVTTLDRATLAFDTVAFSEMVRDVHAPGTLVPEHVRIIVATTGGRVEGLPVRPGETVSAVTTIVQLSNGDVQLAALQVEQQLTQARASLAQLRSSLQQQRITQEGVVAQLRTQTREASRAAGVMDSLDKRHLSSRNEVAAARDRAEELALRYDLERRREGDMRAAEAEQSRLYAEQIRGLERILQDQRDRVAAMRVTAGEAGQLQTLGSPTLELGQWVNSGVELARVAQAGRLKAMLHLPETQAKEVKAGQSALIDTRDGVVPGTVTRVEPTVRGGSVVVEVALHGPLPKGARADLGIDGAIVVDRLSRVLHLGRPAYGAIGSVVPLFRIVPNSGDAMRVSVTLGRASVSTIEILNGLRRGDSIIVSDMAQLATESRVRIK